MIPLHLTLCGFLSYRQPVDIDFTSFDLACISGSNGAGKSSLLDAITWALFGEARRRDDSIINSACDTAEVTLTFSYEGNTYRVQRINPRGKTSLLELQILAEDNSWRPLTERTQRETQARIQSILRLDYETFVNASFFLQGKADTFSQQRPTDRKRILGSILGLEQWEVYRQRTADRRKALEAEIDQLDGRLHEIDAELAEESSRRENLQRIESDLEVQSKQRLSQESLLENIRKVTASLTASRSLLAALVRQLETSKRGLVERQARLAARLQERQVFASLVERQAEIEAGYQSLQEKRLSLARWDEIAAQFRQHESQREAPRLEIQSIKSGLEGELKSLQSQQVELDSELLRLPGLESQLASLQAENAAVEKRIEYRQSLQQELDTLRQAQSDRQAENRALKAIMDELDARIKRLEKTEGAECPLCGQPLTPEDRQRHVLELREQGGQMGDTYRSNKTRFEQGAEEIRRLEAEIAGERKADAELRAVTSHLAQVASQLEILQSRQAAWKAQGALRLQEIHALLASGSYALEARQRLAEVDAALKEIGYDAAAHDLARQAEVDARPFEEQLSALQQARAALAPLENEISDLQSQVNALQGEVNRQQQEYDQAAEQLAAEEAQAPDQRAVEDLLFQLQESENRLRLELGAARQKVAVLDDLKARRADLSERRQELTRLVGQHKQLERAFGKDGIPALLIEQALPEIETRANEVLDRLSDGLMTVRFVTQSAYKDKKRADLRETLDIQISDGAGMREYELYSGGEAFRVNFAIRLALSEVLAKRAGARLQTLVIDEGFGSQDAHGRQRLVEAINLVRPDFAKILVITHIDELKDAFPNRIEVEKTAQGSLALVF